MLTHFLRAVAGAGSGDPQFENVTLLLPGNGTNGAQNNTFRDSSANNLTITRIGNTTQGTFSPYGDYWSNYFDGNGDYLTVPDNAAYETGTNNITLECWIYPTQNSAAFARIISQQGTAGYWVLRQETNTIAYFYLNASTSASVSLNSGAVLTPNLWYHIAVVRNGNTFTLYVNGASVATGTSSGAIPDIARVVAIGAYFETSASEYFVGNISNIRLVSGTAVYTSNFIPPTQPLAAITNTVLLTCQSNRFRDASANNFTITRNGDVSVQRFSPFNPTNSYSSATLAGSSYFDGTGDYLTAPSVTATSLNASFTVEFWYYRRSSSTLYLFTMGDSLTATGIEIYATTSLILYSGGSSRITGPTALPLNAWSHIALTRTGTTVTLWLNGASQGTWTSSATFSGVTYVNAEFYNGTVTVSPTAYISDFRMVKGTAVYTANFTPPTAPLTVITGTSILLSYTNAGIIDNAMMNDLETVGNAQISTAQSKFGGSSISFDGTGDYLLVPSNPNIQFGTGSFTIEGWVYSNNIAATQILLVRRAALNAQGIAIFLSSSAMTFAAGDSNTTAWEVLLTSPTLSSATWYHFAFVRDGSSWRAFVNGVQVGTTTTWAGAIADETSTMVIGADSNFANSVNGYINDLRITKGIARYINNFAPPITAFSTK